MGAKKTTRRQFFKKSAAATMGAVAFPHIIPSTALGADGAVAPSNRLVMATVGTGGQGTYNMRQFLGQPDVQMVAVCDVDLAHRTRAKELVDLNYKNTDCVMYNDFYKVVDRDDIDAVCVATPDFAHAIVSIPMLKSGKDVYCEKPLANSIPESRAILDTVNKYGRILQTGSHERSRYNARYACELVRNGRIGKLHTIKIHLPWDGRDLSYRPEPMPVPAGFDYDRWLGHTPWEPYTEKRCHFFFRYILQYSGGEVTDRGAHVIDIGQLGNNTDHTGPVEVSGQGEFIRDSLFDCATKYHFEFKYANGVQMICTDEWPRGLRFEGTDGWVFIHIHGGELEASRRGLLQEKIGPEEVLLGRSPGHHRDFLNSIKDRTQPMAPAEVGHHSATMCHLANIAMLTGRKLKWDPEKEIITNDPEAQRMVTKTMRSPWKLT